MTQRANCFGLAARAMGILTEQEAYLRQQFSEAPELGLLTWELVKLRVSQINQCAFCIDMHTKEATKLGLSYDHIIGLSAWRDMPMYASTERVALDWAELLTSGASVDDAQYQAAVAVLGEQALVDLSIAVNAINSWNRIAKAFGVEVGSYEPESSGAGDKE